MTTPLLRTKLHIPPVRQEMVPRPRLTKQLNAGLHRKLTLVSAPAGFGKTTLVSEWVSQILEIKNRTLDSGETGPSPISNIPKVAWLSLDENDNNPGRFLAYLIAALQQIDSDIGLALPIMPASDQSPKIESLFTPLINDISKSLADPSKNIGAGFLLVLDDYHVITALAIHDSLAFLLDHLPPQVHLVITSRTDPPLPLSRLRARNQLTELRSANLRFTLDEAADFLNQVMRLGLSTDDVATLEGFTEGWIAGLQMAALSIQGRDDVQSFVQSFSGSHRYILDYLADEVFDRQSEAIQMFLLKTAVLDLLTGDLCDAVLGIGEFANFSGAETLKYLDRANLFIVPLDDDRRWYRYHQLFGDLLRYRLERVMPHQIPALHLRACEWYAQNGMVYEAMGHALAAGDFERAARLVEETDPATMVMRGEVTTLLSWLDALPDDVVHSRPRLSLSCAWALFLTADMDAIEPRVQDALRALAVDEDNEKDWPAAHSPQVEEFLAEAATLRAFVALYQNEARRAIELAQQALGRLSGVHSLIRSAASSALGDAYRRTDNVTAASRCYAEAVEHSQAAGHTLLAMVITNDLARVQVVQGQLGQAADTFRQVLQWGGRQRRPLYPVGQAYVGLGDLLREWNDLDAAERHLRKGISKCELGGYARYLLRGYIALARVKQARGNSADALGFIQKAKGLAQRMTMAWAETLVAAHRARLLLAQGNLAAAGLWARTCRLSTKDAPSYSHQVEYLTLVRVLLAESRGSQNHPNLSSIMILLTRLLQAAKTSGRIGSTIEILALQAMVWHRQDEIVKAMIALEQALALAEPEGYVRLFVDEDAPMAKLLRHAASRGIVPAYVNRLLAAFGVEGQISSPAFIEPLTRRELEVLRLLAAGLSNREIAAELSISVNTVRTHTRKVYGKLNVRSRTQAVARSREWNLL